MTQLGITTGQEAYEAAADRLAALYGRDFGGKGPGRYRIPLKHLRDLLGRRRLYAEDMAALGRAMFERGYVLIDMDTFCVVLSTNSFVNYRRVNSDALR